MSNTQIIVNEIVLETFKDQGFPVSLTRQINDLRKLKTRNASFTSQITFPNTANNTLALSGLTPTFKNSKVVPTSLSCNILMNGVTVLSFGRFTLSAKNDKQYKGTVFFDNFDFFNLIEGDISQLQWATYDQAWQPADVDAIKATTTGIVFALASWFDYTSGILSNTIHDINFSGFHAYTRTIVSNIVTELGFSIDDSAVTDSLWDELALACPVTAFASPAVVASPIEASWSNASSSQSETATTPETTFLLEFDTQVTDPDALFNNGTDQYDIDRTALIRISLENITGTYTVGSGGGNWLKFGIYKNDILLNFPTQISNSGAFNLSEAVVTNVISGDVITSKIILLNGSVTVDTGALFNITDSDSLEDPSDTLIIADWIPKIDKRDFLNWIFAIFNVQVETDNGTVTLKPFDDLLLQPEQNWTKNLDISKPIQETITLPYGQNNKFQYASNNNLKRSDDQGIYTIINDLLKKDVTLIKSGFGATDGAQRDGIYIRGTAVSEYPVYTMSTTRNAGMNTTAASVNITIDNEGASLEVGNYIEVGGEIRQIATVTSDTVATVSTNFDGNNASQAWTLRTFSVKNLTPFRIARIIASQGNYDVVQGTEDVVTSIAGGKEAVFSDSLLWSNIITNSYQNLLDNVANPLIIKARFRFEVSEFASISMLKKVYLEQYASSFYINKILQFRSDGLCFVELIRIN